MCGYDFVQPIQILTTNQAHNLLRDGIWGCYHVVTKIYITFQIYLSLFWTHLCSNSKFLRSIHIPLHSYIYFIKRKIGLISYIEYWLWELVFCYQNCSNLLWEKIVLVIEKNFWNSRLKAREFAKFLRSPEQFIQTAQGQNNFWDRFFFTCSWRFLRSNTLEQL